MIDDAEPIPEPEEPFPETNEELVVEGWRALYFGLCYGGNPEAQPVLCLEGTLGRHVHQNPLPASEHTTSGQNPQSHASPCGNAEQGVGCGYYFMAKPDLECVGANLYSLISRPIIWAWIQALGRVVLHEKGGRAESYLIQRLFWPATDMLQQEAMGAEKVVEGITGIAGSMYYISTTSFGPVGVELPRLAEQLGVPLIRRPVGLWIAENNAMQDAFAAAWEKSLQQGLDKSPPPAAI